MSTIRSLALSLFVLNTIDGVSTVLAITLGAGREINPLMAALLSIHSALFLVVKFGLAAILAHRFVQRASRKPRLVKWVLVGCNAFYTAVLLDHVVLWTVWFAC